MELKEYQAGVLDDLRQYLRTAHRCSTPAAAFARYWKERGVTLRDGAEYLRPYNDSIRGVSNVTVKVPTAGGKTFIACNAIDTIFRELPRERKAVVWFVPSDAILKQTYANLSNPHHPYRQKLDMLFQRRVRVVDKEEALQGLGISPGDTRGQLTVFVLSVQSFIERGSKTAATARNDGDLPRAYRQNAALNYGLQQEMKDRGIRIEGADELSLIQYMAWLNPVLVVDESHNFGTSLRTDVMRNLNPAFVLDLTATPREDSNIISFVDARSLRDAGMTKLPVIVYNLHDKSRVIDDAIRLRNNLEAYAHREQAAGGKYVRPIALLQAEPRSNSDTATFEKIKQALTEQAHIPEEQIKLKISGRDELEGVDLMSRDCPVRYIITVNALKEGWDCPFAYVLATVANRSSRVDVEQVLGRILRQPYTRRLGEGMLNMSYVLTCSDSFNDTLQQIVRGMKLNGYSGRDFRVAEDGAAATPPPKAEETPLGPMLPFADDGGGDDGISLKSHADDGTWQIDEADQMLRKAGEEREAYDKAEKEERQTDSGLPKEIDDAMTHYRIIDRYKDEAARIVLPNLYIKYRSVGGLFADSTKLVPVNLGNLLEGFDLRKQDRNIDFSDTTQMAAVDVAERQTGEYVATIHSLDDRQVWLLKQQMETMSAEEKRNQLSISIARQLSDNDNMIGYGSYLGYVGDILETMDGDRLAWLADRMVSTLEAIREKVRSLEEDYACKRFKMLCDTNAVVSSDVKGYHFSTAIVINKETMQGLPKQLYAEEEKGNAMENNVAGRMAQLDNVLFWHRNQGPGHGFGINGYTGGHYPDFIVVTKSHNIVLVETKGQQLANADSEYKIEIGRRWTDLSGERYHYFMVFPDGTQPLKGAITVSGLMERLRDL